MRALGIGAAVAILTVAAASAQAIDARAAAAVRAATSMCEAWFGRTLDPPTSVTIRGAWPDAPLSMDVEAAAAFEVTRKLWSHQPPTALMDGASLYLRQRIVSSLFDVAAGRAGDGVETLPLFGRTYTFVFPQLRFDAPASGLRRAPPGSPVVRAAHAFASLERIVGSPRLIGALQSVIEQQPGSDDSVIALLQDALGQDISWLFGNRASMDYSIASVMAQPCASPSCTRVRVEVAHRGEASFDPIEVRVTFDDGQTAAASWNGRGPTRSFVFEGQGQPAQISVDPDLKNLLDDDLLNQTRRFGSRTNVPLTKWVARWAVWLQNAMLSAIALV